MLAEIKVNEGQTVPIQTVVAVLETERRRSGARRSGVRERARRRPPSAPKPRRRRPLLPAPRVPADRRPRPPSPQPPTPVSLETAEERLRRRSTPLVRKIAAEHQVDITAVPGSGLAGRVTKKDILGYLETGGTEVRSPGSGSRPPPP